MSREKKLWFRIHNESCLSACTYSTSASKCERCVHVKRRTTHRTQLTLIESRERMKKKKIQIEKNTQSFGIQVGMHYITLFSVLSAALLLFYSHSFRAVPLIVTV